MTNENCFFGGGDSALLTAALAYASLGYRALPTAGKKPIFSDWQSRATTNETIIRGWWAEYTNADVAIATGNGVFVLDIDPYHRGDESLSALVAEHGELPLTVMTRTGRGWHYWFRGDAKCSAGLIAPGVDIRGENGYVVVPPSTHSVSGTMYLWWERTLCVSGELPVAPTWLLEAAQVESEYEGRENV